MNIIGEGLTFDDVLLVPRCSTITSRFTREISLGTKLLPSIELDIPLISANMDTVTEVKMANTMHRLGGLGVIHRFLPPAEVRNQIIGTYGPRVLCIGVGDKSIGKVEFILDLGIDGVLIDVAHGHSLQVLKLVRELKSRWPNLGVIAGNIATAEAADELATAGADCLKVGVGPGCFAAGTRVLMANGFYKNIEDVCVGDYVISGQGKPTKVVGTQCTGKREVVEVRHTHNAFGTVCTPDHRYWCGDLNSISKSTLANSGYSFHLDRQSKTTPKRSKYKWKEIGKFKQDVALMPRKIEFDLPVSFSKTLPYRNQEDICLAPSYELGYVFGFFLGDGNASCTLNKKRKSRSGCICFYPEINQLDIVDKLKKSVEVLFNKELKAERAKGCWNLTLYCKPFADFLLSFGKKTEKHLPQDLLVLHKEYLMGVLQGLQDSDGIDSDRIGFSNTSRQLTEVYMVLTYILKESFFPSLEPKTPTVGGLDCNIDNCKPAYLSRVCPSYEKRLTQDYQVIKVLDYKELGRTEKVYDIEVECSSHSFIADNAIVHNSLCTTRIQTGNGVPQLTAIQNVVDGLAKNPRGSEVTIIADGGIRNSGDIIKALAVGADAVMIGGLLAGTTETPGNVESTLKGGFKKYRGMASRDFQEEVKGQATSVEGETRFVKHKGPAKEVINTLVNGLRSGMSYQNARSITELQANAKFIKQSVAGRMESLPHGIGT